jgi:hypothetical protein
VRLRGVSTENGRDSRTLGTQAGCVVSLARVSVAWVWAWAWACADVVFPEAAKMELRKRKKKMVQEMARGPF